MELISFFLMQKTALKGNKRLPHCLCITCCAVQLVIVMFEMRSHEENALLMTVKISKVFFMYTLIHCVTLFSTTVTCLFLINSAGVMDRIDAEKHKLSLHSLTSFFSTFLQTVSPQKFFGPIIRNCGTVS